jgi:hypothetical protein
MILINPKTDFASNDIGATLGDTHKLSNTTDAKSDGAWLEVEGSNAMCHGGNW